MANSAAIPRIFLFATLLAMNEFADWFQTSDIFSLPLASLSLAIA
ncbi:MAG: hypothetical protein JWP79_1217, partial [Polaromonas sp.]|nr:hypothetical protein [Polaromonas sp.]